MTKFVKFAALAATVLATTTPAFAAPVGVSGGPPPSATARIIKPLVLTSTGALNFGTIVLNGVSANRTVALSQGNVLDCGAATTELQCSGATTVPTYNVKGTNNQDVNVILTASPLTNANDSTTLSMQPTFVSANPLKPGKVTLPNSGTAGADFNIGGTIVIGTATTDGVYSGVVNVTVDY